MINYINLETLLCDVYRKYRNFEKIIIYLLKEDRNLFTNLSKDCLIFLNSLANDINLNNDYSSNFYPLNKLALSPFTIEDYNRIFPICYDSEKEFIKTENVTENVTENTFLLENIKTISSLLDINHFFLNDF